jgi:hypothetical protein
METPPRVRQAGSAVYEDTDETAWRSANVFERCVSVRIDGARGLPSANEMTCEACVGHRVQELPLLLSHADLEAGGGGRVDGGQLSERVDLLIDQRPAALRLRVQAKIPGPVWTERIRTFLGEAPVAERFEDAASPAAGPPEWIDLHECSEDEGWGRASSSCTGHDGGIVSGSRAAPAHDLGPGEVGGACAPALLVRVQCFDRANLESPGTRRRLIALYSASGGDLTAAEFERLLTDVGSGRRVASGELDAGAYGGAFERPRGIWRQCVGHALAVVGFYKPEVPLFSYLMYYHTLMWVVCRAPGEEHIPICHRLSFLGLSLGFNLFVVVLFTATDMSLTSVHCEDTSERECSRLEYMAWEAAQVLVVALIDTAFWPLLKSIFYFVEDLWSGRSPIKLLNELSERAWCWVRAVLLSLALLVVLWLSLSAARHRQQLDGCLNEFLTTWPSARFIETFKLMSFWGTLVEYGLPEPPPAAGAPVAAVGRRSPRKSEPDQACATSAYTLGQPPRHPPPTLPITAGAATPGGVDSKRVPLLSAQH